MIRVLGLYRWQDGAHFDHDYYNTTHMQVTQELLEPHGLLRLESDRYLIQGQPSDGEIIAASNAYFRDLESARTAMSRAGQQLMQDVPNYTNLRPEIKLVHVTTHS